MNLMHLTYDQIMSLRHHDAIDCSLIELPNMPFWNSSKKTDEQKKEIQDRALTLQAGINLDYNAKCRHFEKVVKRAFESERIFRGKPKKAEWAVSFSGGRDSTVLSHFMVYGMGLKTVHVNSNTRMEYPETLKQIRIWYEMLQAAGIDCHVTYPDIRPGELWATHGVPLFSKELAYKYHKYFQGGKMSPHVPDWAVPIFERLKKAGIKLNAHCCHELKKKPMKKWDKAHGVDAHFTGVRANESRVRRMAWMMKGSLYFSTMHRAWICNPMAFWTEADVARYLADNKIEILRPDTPQGGSGCVTCMFGCHLAAASGNPNTLQDLETRNPKMYLKALNEWGYRPALDVAGIPYSLSQCQTSQT